MQICCEQGGSNISHPQAAGTDDGPEGAPPPSARSGCPACRKNRSQYDRRHTRVRGECKLPDTISFTGNSPGCLDGLPRHHPSHTQRPESCRWAVADYRGSGPRGEQRRHGRPRIGHHPRDGRVRASEDPTAVDKAGGDLRAEEAAEERALQRAEAARAEAAALQDDERAVEDCAEGAPASSSSGRSSGDHTGPRERIVL